MSRIDVGPRECHGILGVSRSRWKSLNADNYNNTTSDMRRAGRRVHRLETLLAATALRITVTATNGLDHARLCEVRVY